ncbi:hypothetical protein [Paenibacillus brasilensis]
MEKAQYTVQQYSCTCNCVCFSVWLSSLATTAVYNSAH